MLGYQERVNIKKKVKVNSEWRFAALAENKGKIRWDWVIVNDFPEHHPEGTYYLEWREGKLRRQQPVSGSPVDILNAAKKKYTEVQAVRQGIIKEEELSKSGVKRLLVVDAIQDYMDIIKSRIRPDGKGWNTWRKYRMVMSLLKSTCRKKFLDQLDHSDARHFLQACYKEGNGARTANHKLVIVSQFLKKFGVSDFVDKDDWPKYVEKRREVYEEDDLKAFMKACKPYDRMLFRFFVHTGFRDREVIHVTWADIDFKQSVAYVVAKPNWKFCPKNYEERAVPVRASFMAELKAFKPKNAQPWHPIFPNPRMNPDLHLLQRCKRVAFNAELNCGQCVNEHRLHDGSVRINRCAVGPYCNKWNLHKFRHTWATRLLQQNVVDIRTLQVWIGHQDLATTMIYLKAIQNKDAQARLANFSVAGD